MQKKKVLSSTMTENYNNNMKINLVQNGIFPIKTQLEKDSTGYKVPGTIQGEGLFLGTSCIFIRTSGCNLRCSFLGLDGKGSPCDTPYSSHFPEKNLTEISDVVQTVKDNTKDQGIRHVVISGGEPTIQTAALEELVYQLWLEGYLVTIETNATIFSEKLTHYAHLISMSPKLSNSTPWVPNLEGTGIKYNDKWAERHERDRINIKTISEYILATTANCNLYQLKFVVATDDDIREIESILEQLPLYSPEMVYLMPEGVDAETLTARSNWCVEQAIQRGWSFTPRLHVMLWGKNRYV